MKQICIYPKDAALLMGISVSHARRIIREIKKKHHKARHQYVTIDEFCEYTGLCPERVYAEM
ncbi:MAG TPA: hypothetical protein VJ899_01470 [Salegentibacter sp.]|nr:hypothetical protein [Salegentibacter sp.]